MSIEDLWPPVETLRRQLSRRGDPAAALAAAALGLNGPGWTLLLRAHLYAPEPISASRLGGNNPYVNPWTYEAGLQHLASVGLLAATGESDYTLTSAGRAALPPIRNAIYEQFCLLAPLPAADLERLAALLEKLVAASLSAPEPPRKPLLRLSHGLALTAPDHALVRVDQAVADLAAFRDDTHLAAWQPLMVSGPAWDTLSALWRGTPGTLEEVFGKMVRRGWPRDVYARALQELVRQDWVRGPEPYALTPQGRHVRERAEAQTNRVFFAPWPSLGAEALADLRGLLARLNTALQAGAA